jgi:hypothetical protein
MYEGLNMLTAILSVKYNRTINIQTSNSLELHLSELNEFQKSKDVFLILSLQKELFINVIFNHCSNFLRCWSSNDKKKTANQKANDSCSKLKSKLNVQTCEKVLPMVAGCLKIKISGTPAKAYSLTLLPHYYLLKACVFQIC